MSSDIDAGRVEANSSASDVESGWTIDGEYIERPRARSSDDASHGDASDDADAAFEAAARGAHLSSIIHVAGQAWHFAVEVFHHLMSRRQEPEHSDENRVDLAQRRDVHPIVQAANHASADHRLEDDAHSAFVMQSMIEAGEVRDDSHTASLIQHALLDAPARDSFAREAKRQEAEGDRLDAEGILGAEQAAKIRESAAHNRFGAFAHEAIRIAKLTLVPSYDDGFQGLSMPCDKERAIEEQEEKIAAAFEAGAAASALAQAAGGDARAARVGAMKEVLNRPAFFAEKKAAPVGVAAPTQLTVTIPSSVGDEGKATSARSYPPLPESPVAVKGFSARTTRVGFGPFSLVGQEVTDGDTAQTPTQSLKKT